MYTYLVDEHYTLATEDNNKKTKKIIFCKPIE